MFRICRSVIIKAALLLVCQFIGLNYIFLCIGYVELADKKRHEETWQGKTRQDKTRQDKRREEKRRQDTTGQTDKLHYYNQSFSEGLQYKCFQYMTYLTKQCWLNSKTLDW